MEDNVYIKELRNQIDLVLDEQLGNEDEADGEKLTEEEQKLFDDFGDI